MSTGILLLAFMGLCRAALIAKLPSLIELMKTDFLRIGCSTDVAGGGNSIQWFHYPPGERRQIIYGFDLIYHAYSFVTVTVIGGVSLLSTNQTVQNLAGQIGCQDEHGRGELSTGTLVFLDHLACYMAPIEAPPLLALYSRSKWSLRATCQVRYSGTMPSSFSWHYGDEDGPALAQQRLDVHGMIILEIIVNRDDSPDKKKIRCRSSNAAVLSGCSLDLNPFHADWRGDGEEEQPLPPGLGPGAGVGVSRARGPAPSPNSGLAGIAAGYGVLIIIPLLGAFVFWIYLRRKPAWLQEMPAQSKKAWLLALGIVGIGPMVGLFYLYYCNKQKNKSPSRPRHIAKKRQGPGEGAGEWLKKDPAEEPSSSRPVPAAKSGFLKANVRAAEPPVNRIYRPPPQPNSPVPARRPPTAPKPA